MRIVKHLLTTLALYFVFAQIGATPLAAQDVTYMKCLTCTTDCSCYWSSECGSGQYCNYGSGCTVSGKKDGTCTTNSGGLGGFGAISVAVGFYFQAYEVPLRGAGGLPDIRLVRQAQTQALPAAGHLAVQRIIQNALDLSLGWDFVGPQACIGSGAPEHLGTGSLGQIRLPGKDAPPAAAEMLAAMRQAVLEALKGKDANLVAGPIQAFWKKYPDYQPRHTGRCWPHGHSDFPYKTPADCQIDELKRMLGPMFKPEGKEQSLNFTHRLEGVSNVLLQEMASARCVAPAKSAPEDVGPSQE